MAEGEGPLLQFLLGALPGWKRATVKERLRRGAVRVNGVAVTRHDHALKAGDIVEVLPGRMAPGGEGRRARIRLLYDDRDLVAIDKPAGLLSVATEREHERTAMHLTRLLLQERGARRSQRLWAVHRLDRETSGVLLFAKSRAVQQRLRANWTDVEKTYLAIVRGVPARGSGRITASLRQGRGLRVYAEPGAGGAKPAATRYRVLATLRDYAMLEIAPETGRKHQIRVHLAAAGHAVAGDPLYGAGDDPVGRLALHAHRLCFTHPRTSERISLTSPLPEAMAEFVSRRRKPPDAGGGRLVYLEIGSNRDAVRKLRSAVRLLRDKTGLLALSPVYRTEAFGDAGGGDYLNAVAVIETGLDLPRLKSGVLEPIEKLLGRVRDDPARVAIDLDPLLVVSRETGREEWVCDLRHLDRPYVLVPLADVAAGTRHPLTGEPIVRVAARVRKERRMRPVPDVLPAPDRYDAR